MIKVNVVRDNKEIKSIEIKGHSGYDEYGKDIVCSSVSTSVILTINLLEKLNVKFDYKSDDNIPLISLSINQLESLEQSNLVQIILENLVDNLTMVEKEYNKNLKIYEIRR